MTARAASGARTALCIVVLAAALLDATAARAQSEPTARLASEGGSLEAGDTWSARSDVSLANLRKAVSLFVGLDTYVGPFYVAYGRTSGGDSSFYVFLERP